MMLRKILPTLILALAVFIGQTIFSSKALANDVYVCTDGGLDYYVTLSHFTNWGNQSWKGATIVKGVKGGKIEREARYVFEGTAEWGKWKNPDFIGRTFYYIYPVEQGSYTESGKVTEDNLALQLFKYCLKHP